MKTTEDRLKSTEKEIAHTIYQIHLFEKIKFDKSYINHLYNRAELYTQKLETLTNRLASEKVVTKLLNSRYKATDINVTYYHDNNNN